MAEDTRQQRTTTAEAAALSSLGAVLTADEGLHPLANVRLDVDEDGSAGRQRGSDEGGSAVAASSSSSSLTSAAATATATRSSTATASSLFGEEDASGRLQLTFSDPDSDDDGVHHVVLAQEVVRPEVQKLRGSARRPRLRCVSGQTSNDCQGCNKRFFGVGLRWLRHMDGSLWCVWCLMDGGRGWDAPFVLVRRVMRRGLVLASTFSLSFFLAPFYIFFATLPWRAIDQASADVEEAVWDESLTKSFVTLRWFTVAVLVLGLVLECLPGAGGPLFRPTDAVALALVYAGIVTRVVGGGLIVATMVTVGAANASGTIFYACDEEIDTNVTYLCNPAPDTIGQPFFLEGNICNFSAAAVQACGYPHNNLDAFSMALAFGVPGATILVLFGLLALWLTYHLSK